MPSRIASAGDHFSLGDVSIEVLHPPSIGPEGNENARSMVLMLRHAGHSILLTGDLEGPGLARVLAMAAQPVDILMSPHHGSKTANTPSLAAWAKPRVVISCEGPPRGQTRAREPYSASGAQFLGTWPHGAVTVHSRRDELAVETFQSGQRLMVRSQLNP